MVTLSEPTQAINRARRAGVSASERVAHPACRELVAMDAAMLDMCEHLRELAGCVEDDGLVAEIDAVIRGLQQ